MDCYTGCPYSRFCLRVFYYPSAQKRTLELKDAQEETSIWTVLRFIVGLSLLLLMGYIWVFVKEFEIILFAIPAALMGVVNPYEWIKPRK